MSVRAGTATTFVGAAGSAVRLDYSLLRRALLIAGLSLQFLTPLAHDPLEFGVGLLVPWILMLIVGTPNMPAAFSYFVLWQWLEVFAREIITFFNDESIFNGVYGPTVGDAYWYMLASLAILAVGFRLALSGIREPAGGLRLVHRGWRTADLFACYLVTFAISCAYSYGVNALPSIDQQIEALSRLKILALVLLFANVLSSRKNWQFLLAAVAIEFMSGFGGLFSDFKQLFIVLAVAALAQRIKWSGSLAFGLVAWAGIALGLALFWTSVKTDYRQFATNSDESQWIKVSLAGRYTFLGSKAAELGDIDWDTAAYALVNRIAYVDVLGSVISVQEMGPANDYPRQWMEAIDHILMPRILFPDKAALSDTDVYVRLALGNVSEDMRLGTSISVGYMSENYADFGFPGMLLGVFALGLMVGSMSRYFMMCPLPWMVREGIVLGLVYTCGNTGVEMSLPKIIGAAMMYFIIFALLVRFVFGGIWRWLENRATFGNPVRPP